MKKFLILLTFTFSLQSFAQENGIGIKMGLPFYFSCKNNSYQCEGNIEKSISYFHKSPNRIITGFKFQSDFLYLTIENAIIWPQNVYMVRNYYPSFLFGGEFLIGKMRLQTLLNLGIFATSLTNRTHIPYEKSFALSAFFLEPEIKFSLLPPSHFNIGIYISPNFIYDNDWLYQTLLSAGIYAEISIPNKKVKS